MFDSLDLLCFFLCTEDADLRSLVHQVKAELARQESLEQAAALRKTGRFLGVCFFTTCN